MATRWIDLDAHATTPVDPRVFEAMTPYFQEHYGNPSSTRHALGWKADLGVEQARAALAQSLGTTSESTIFTCGATESIHTTLLGYAFAHPQKQLRILISPVEHKAVFGAIEVCKAFRIETEFLKMNSQGLIDLDHLKDQLKTPTDLVFVIHGNNEIGTINPVREIADIVHEANSLIHVDAAQSFGKVDLSVDRWDLDFVSISGHKIYGPKGIGALTVSTRAREVGLAPLFAGGGQERGLRAGTLNVPGIVGLASAAEIAVNDRAFEAVRLQNLREIFSQGLREIFPQSRINGHATERLPNNLNISFLGATASQLGRAFRQVACSSGSACTGAQARGSHVLTALGMPLEEQALTLRFGLGRSTSLNDIQEVLERARGIRAELPI